MTHKFFQHVDQYDKETFLHVTELSYIDDTDPSIILYHFDDGTKCNIEFIGESVDTTTESINNLAFVQVSNKSQIWKCNIVETKAQERKARTANGEEVIVPDRTMFSVTGESLNDITQYNWVKPISKKINNDDILLYYISTIKSFLETGELPIELYNPDIHDLKYKWSVIYNMEQIADHIPNYLIPENLTPNFSKYLRECDYNHIPKNEEIKEEKNETIVTPVKNTENIIEDNNSEKLEAVIVKLCGNRKAEISYKEDGTYIIEDSNVYMLADLIDAYNSLQDEDVPAELEQPKNPRKSILGANKETVAFLSDMIANAAKKTAEASVSIELDVPPFDVYKLLKTVYPEDWANIFIELIATSVSPEDLQSALGEGLKAYYDNEMENHSK